MHSVIKSAAVPGGVLLTTQASPTNVQSCRPLQGQCPAQVSLSTLHVSLLYFFCLMYKYQTLGFAGSARTSDIGGTAAQAGLVPVGRERPAETLSRARWVTLPPVLGRAHPSPGLETGGRVPKLVVETTRFCFCDRTTRKGACYRKAVAAF